MINNEIIESYLNCKYKAYRKLNNEQGVKTEFELLQDERRYESRIVDSEEEVIRLTNKGYDCQMMGVNK